MFRKSHAVNPPIFAELVIEANGQQARFDVETLGYLQQVEALMPLANRAGLALLGKPVAVWVAINGHVPRYYSQVIGQISNDGHKQKRVACLDCGDYQAWLHKDGVVEVGLEPTVRW